jgi:hypothetical protein
MMSVLSSTRVAAVAVIASAGADGLYELLTGHAAGEMDLRRDRRQLDDRESEFRSRMPR